MVDLTSEMAGLWAALGTAPAHRARGLDEALGLEAAHPLQVMRGQPDLALARADAELGGVVADPASLGLDAAFPALLAALHRFRAGEERSGVGVAKTAPVIGSTCSIGVPNCMPSTQR